MNEMENDIRERLSELSKLGYTLIKEKKFDEAEKKFNEILKTDDENNYALVGLGDIERKGKTMTERSGFTRDVWAFI